MGHLNCFFMFKFCCRFAHDQQKKTLFFFKGVTRHDELFSEGEFEIIIEKV